MPPPPSGCDADSAPSRSTIVGRGTAASGHYVLDIEGYSHTKEIPTGRFIRSKSFRSVGHSWRILYFLNGRNSETSGYISVMLVLNGAHGATEPVEARARFSLLDRAGKPVSHTRTTRVYNYSSYRAHGYTRFIKRANLEKSEHLEHDRFSVRCDVFLAKKVFRTEDRKHAPLVTVPTSDLHRHFGHLLETKDGADVTFQVAGETFMAHRCVLAARSPVFKAEVFGKMKEGTDGAVIRVDDMDAQVFKTLLDFVYTDMLPDGLNSKNMTKNREGAAMAQHLLVAADRYSLERLKLMCEDMLCNHIDTNSAATILTLAEQHQCHGLKEACFRFLSTPSTLNAVMATDDFDHLTRSCPSVLKQLMSNIAARLPGDFGEAR